MNQPGFIDGRMSLLDTLNFAVYSNQGGGEPGEQATAPSPLLVYALDTTSTAGFWQNTGADNYVYERATQSDFSDAEEVESDQVTNFGDSSLTMGGTYYYRVKAQKAGVADSEWVTASVQTISFMPHAWYEFVGMARNVENDYGTAASNGTISSFKSIVNASGPLLSKNASANAAAIRHQPTTPRTFAFQNIVTNAGYYDMGSNIVLSGDFTIALEMVCPTTGGTRYILSWVGGTDHIFFPSTPSTLRVNFGSTNYNPAPTATLVAGTVYKLVFERSGTNLRVSIDGGATWGSAVTVATGDFTINRTWASNLGGNSLSHESRRIMFYSGGALTKSQLDQFFNYCIPAAVAPIETPSSVSVKGLTFAALTDNRWTDATSAADNHAGPHRKAVWSIGNTHIIASNKDSDEPDLSDVSLRVLNGANGEGSSLVDLGHLTESEDVHNIGSLTPPLNNRIYYVQQNQHYGLGYSKHVVRSTGNGFDFSGVMSIPPGKGVPNYVWSETQYNQVTVVGDNIYMASQEYDTTFPRRVVLGKCSNLFQSWDWKVSICDFAAAPDWSYPHLIYAPSHDEIILIINHVVNPDGSKWVYFVRISLDGTTATNLDGTFSKNLVTSGALTIAELETNCLVFDGDALGGNSAFQQFFVTEDGLLYGVISDGEQTGWRLATAQIGVAGWTFKDITWGGKTVVTATTNDDTGAAGVGAYNRAMPVGIRVGDGQFRVFGLESNSGNWRIIETATDDGGDTWDYVADISPTADAAQYLGLSVSHNHEYNDHTCLRATRATSATAGTTFAKVIR